MTSNSETATTTEDSTTMTVNSPITSAANAFQPFQQLHEAVLAAVNSHSGSLSNSIFSAVAAAAAANNNNNNNNNNGTNVTIHPQPFDQTTQDQRVVLTDAERAKKEGIRASNRERKKKWRLHNEERNKDNDLRCRVNKRATKLYGAGDSPAKQQWVEEEFEKRRQKRLDKDRRKHIVNDVLTGPSATTSGDNNSNSIQLPDITSAYYTPLPQIDTATAAKLLDFPTDLQRQLLEQLNNSMLALSNGIQQTPETTEQNNPSTEAQPVDTTSFVTDATDNNEESKTTNIKTEATEVTNEVIQQVITHGLSSSTSTVENSPLQFSEVTDAQVNETTATESKSDSKQEDTKEEKTEEKKEGKKQEYPMDAVLTLMQLNAGWRQ